ncbi:phosphoglycerate mutase-like protein 1 [Cajanus cajan]|uniref:phosphoglycerate mutase-like protein 1 n=1 Tax=Cajanus cajan TaxID=3821 RepID=UPI00098D9E44|nr:phosphoglycerate mutase-like protein 1 [Cajanus cajan]
MDSGGGSGPSLFPLHRCKTIHLVRHAQGIHNVDGDKNYKAYMNPDYFDAHLTPLGWNQVHYLRNHVRHSGLLNRIDLVIASPLLRFHSFKLPLPLQYTNIPCVSTALARWNVMILSFKRCLGGLTKESVYKIKLSLDS